MTAKSGTQTRWQAAIDLARQRIDAMTFGDEATLLLAGDPPQVLSAWTGRRADLRHALLSAQVGSTVTDIRPALQLAQNLASGHPSAIIDLISDSVWPVAPPGEDMAHVRLDRIGDSIPNSGITLFSARELSNGAGEYQLALQIEQNTTAPMQGELEITRNGQLMDELEVTVPPGAPWLKLWRGQATDACDFTAKWKPQKDENFTADQEAETKLAPVRPVTVSLISPAVSFSGSGFWQPDPDRSASAMARAFHSDFPARP